MQRLVVFYLAAWLTSGCSFAQPVALADTAPALSKKSSAAPGRDSDLSIEKLALDVASEHLSVPPGELEIVRIEAVQWPDSSIGCPEPDFEYLQVVTPGHLAHVRGPSGVIHRVHMANGRGLVCEKRADESYAKGAGRLPTFTQRQLEALARADLANRLAVPTNEVSVRSSRAVEWPDATLGCSSSDEFPASGSRGPVGPSKGFVITLVHERREYTYHSSLQTVIPCPPIEGR